MIDQLDDMLTHLLRTRLNDSQPQTPIDVEVRPPDDAWRAFVNTIGRPAVNLYMAEVREDREQRTTRASRKVNPEPFRIDCHYLISAWVPSTDPSVGTPTIVEDWLLGESIRVLADEAPVNARTIYSNNPPANLDPSLVDNDLRTEITPPQGYANLADFWTGVGQGNVWRAAAHVIVTLPLVRTSRPVGPPVTTLHTTYRPGEERIVHIGGTVRNSQRLPVVNAWVRLEDPTGSVSIQTTATDDGGRFRMSGLTEGMYQIHARSPGLQPAILAITVPSPNGSYEIVLN